MVSPWTHGTGRTRSQNRLVRCGAGRTRRSGAPQSYGQAHRGYDIPNAVDTRFAIASGGKGFTALALVSLIEQYLAVLDGSAACRTTNWCWSGVLAGGFTTADMSRFWLHPTGQRGETRRWGRGVSFLSVHQTKTGETTTALGKTAEGVLPSALLLDPQE